MWANLDKSNAAQWEANGWKFYPRFDGSRWNVEATTSATTRDGKPTFDRYQDAEETASYLALSGL